MNIRIKNIRTKRTQPRSKKDSAYKQKDKASSKKRGKMTKRAERVTREKERKISFNSLKRHKRLAKKKTTGKKKI